MAVPILAKEFPQVYAHLLESRKQGRHRLSHLEQETFGWTHGRAAGMLVRQWNLPEEFAVLIEGHTGDSSDSGQGGEPEQQIVVLSALLPSTADPLWYECSQWEELFGKTCPATTSPAALFQQVDREFAEFAPLLQLAAPRKSLVESHQEAMAPA